MKNVFYNLLIATVVLSLNCAPIAVYAMPNPVPAAQTDKQKAAEKKKKEAEKAKAQKAKEKEKAAKAKEKEKAAKEKAKAQADKNKAKAQADKEKAAAQAEKNKAKAQADKEKAAAQAEKYKAKEQADKAKAAEKAQAQREKEAAERAKIAAQKEEERAKAAALKEEERARKEAQEKELQEKQVREYEKQLAELENPKPEPVSFLNIGLRAGYSAMMDKFQGSYMGAGTLNQSNALQQLKGGGGAGIDFSYSLAYLHFMFETGLDVRFLNSTSAYGFTVNRPDLTYGATYSYLFDNLVESRNMLGVGIPVMFGAQFEQFYFLLGAKVHYNLPMGYSQKGKYDIVVNDPALVEPYGMGIHEINGQTNTKIAFKQPDISLAAEIGIDLDDWLQEEPDPKKNAKVKPGQRLPFGREYIHYRVGLFAEYGVLNSNGTQAANPTDFAANDVLVQKTNTLLAMNGNTVLNNLFVGAKFTIQFEIPGKKPSQLTPPASFAYYKVVNADNQEPIELAFVETKEASGKVAMREKQIKAKGAKQRHAPGLYTTKVRAEGYYEETQSFEIEKVGVTKYVTIAMRPLPVFRVRVTNAETGAAIPAHIQIMQRNATEPAYTLATDSASGSARTRLDEALQYNLHIEQMGYEAVDMQIANVGDSMNIALKPIKKGEVFIMKNMFFATNKTRILAISEESLQDLYMYLERNPQIRIKIVGHTDNIGKDAANQKLSEGRANEVKKDLIERGIAPERLESEGRGESQPIDTNDTEEGRQNNRRVEIEIL